ncbi:hypothetical protein [Trinickia dinghuensis]|uniref:Adhesin n=1 Tax=Trinickia dinghuensis TaxID=2291023 RepID=A0A3D8JVQ3_9BURK|nr:hypothetical protein [Trinickia dinghuensis]RDU97188.1 hypothetical protein DWV00_21105 [Trinickia dinghuensis]
MFLILLASTRRLAQAALLPGIAAALAAAAPSAHAQASGNPGDIIVERQVMPRDAFQALPRDENPVAVRATTFPAPAFDSSVATVVSDADLTQAHGSQGVANTGGGVASLQALTKLLGGSATGSNVAMGPGGLAPTTTGVGGTISMSVTGAVAPLTSALSGVGGLK